MAGPTLEELIQQKYGQPRPVTPGPLPLLSNITTPLRPGARDPIEDPPEVHREPVVYERARQAHEALLPALNQFAGPWALREAFGETRDLDRPERAQVGQQLEGQKSRVDQFYKGVQDTIVTLRLAGSDEQADELEQAFKDHMNPGLLRRAKATAQKGLGKGLRLLDTPQRTTRRITGPFLDEKRPLGEIFDSDVEPMSLDEWNKKIAERAQKPGTNPISYAAQRWPQAAGLPLTAWTGTITAGLGAASDVLRGNMPNLGNMGGAYKDAFKSSADFMRAMMTDPTSFLAGVGSEARGIGQLTRAMQGIGVPAAKAAQIAEQAMTAYRAADQTAVAIGGKRTAAFEAAAQVFRSNGISEAALLKAAGSRGQFLGRGGLAIQASPFGGPQVDIAQLGSKIPGALLERPFLGAVNAISDAKRAIPKLGGGHILDPIRDAHKIWAKQVIAAGKMTEAEWQGEARELAKLAPADREKRIALMKQTIDPDYDVTRLGSGSRWSAEIDPAILDNGDELARHLVAKGTLPAGSKVITRAEKNAFNRSTARPHLDSLAEERANLANQSFPLKGNAIETRLQRALDEFRALGGDPDEAARLQTMIDDALEAKSGANLEKAIDQLFIKLDEPTKQVHYGVTPKAGYRSFESLGPEERAFVSEWQELMDRRHQTLVETGVLEPGQKARNLLSGMYAPRRYESDYSFLDDLNEERMLGIGSAAKSRADGGGLALGSDRVVDAPPIGQAKWNDPTTGAKLTGKTDPLEVLPQYQREASGLAQRKLFEKHLVDQTSIAANAPEVAAAPARFKVIGDRAVPMDLHNIMTRNFDWSMSTMSGALRRIPGFAGNPAGRAIMQGVEWWQKLTSRFKRLVLPNRLGYHALNIVNDVQYMVALGMNNPAKWLKSAFEGMRGSSTTIKVGGKTAGKTMSLGQLADEAQRMGLGSVAKNRLDDFAGGVMEEVGQLQRIAKGKSAKSRTQKALSVGEKAGEWWTDHSRTAAYMFRRAQGDTPEEALRAVLDQMIDYSDRPGWLNVARWFMPFATYQFKAPLATARAAVKRPAALNVPNRFFEAFAGDERPGVEPRSYVTERGPAYPTNERVRDFVSALRERLGGTPIPESEGTYTLSRDPFLEPLTPFAEALGGNFRPFVNSLDPVMRMGAEWSTGTDYLTHRPMDLDVGSPLNPQTPAWATAGLGAAAGGAARGIPGAIAGGAVGLGLGAGDWAEAGPGQQGWLARYFSGHVASPHVLWGANYATQQQQGATQGAPATFGASRPYDPQGVPANVLASGLFSQLTGFPTYNANQADALYNQTHTPEFEAALRAAEAMRQQIESIKRATAMRRLRGY